MRVDIICLAFDGPGGRMKGGIVDVLPHRDRRGRKMRLPWFRVVVAEMKPETYEALRRGIHFSPPGGKPDKPSASVRCVNKIDDGKLSAAERSSWASGRVALSELKVTSALKATAVQAEPIEVVR